MSESRWTRLEDVILDSAFPDLDLALRRGRHVDRDDLEWYALVTDAQDHLEAFYRRYGCELVHKSDGYYYLLPTTDRLGRRHLSAGEMLVGQALALLYLDPKASAEGGRVPKERVLEHLAGVVGAESLVRVFNPKRRRYDERVAAETVRTKVDAALRRLGGLGFLDLTDDGGVRLRTALLRFAEPVRGAEAPEANLERLIRAGEVVFADEAVTQATDDGEGELEDAARADDADDDDDDAVAHEDDEAIDAPQGAAEDEVDG